MIYNINFGIGWASSGVEYAQSYRAKCFRKINTDFKFVFLDFVNQDYIQRYTSNIGFKDNEIIWLYLWFTDLKLKPLSMTIEDFEKTINLQTCKKEKTKYGHRYVFSAKDYIELHVVDNKYIYKSCYVTNGFLIRQDYFSYTKMYTEFFAPYKGKANLYLRIFYNEDGSIAYEQFVDNNKEMFKIGKDILCDKQEFLKRFIKELNLSKKDIVIMDRSEHVVQTFFENRGEAKLGVVVHADHYSANYANDDYLLWNNFYEYEFKNNKYVDFYLCSTDEQTKLLKKQFKQYAKANPDVITIPVGSIRKLTRTNKKRKKFSLITASRLASEKHIDWIIYAVAKAKEALPELTLDVYGHGVLRDKLDKQINDLGAQDYIHMMGHQNVDKVYIKYEAYLSGSTSEGFGLSLLEAVASGLPIIGFKVNYGNVTFVDDHINGILVKREDDDTPKILIDKLAQAIIDFYKECDVDKASYHSYNIASEFLDSNIVKKWKSLLEKYND